MKLKVGIARALCNSASGAVIERIYGDRIPHDGCRIFTDSPVVSRAVKASIAWGFYERAELDFVSKYLRRDLDVVELGSSLGVVASHLARMVGKDLKLICVEADRTLAQMTARNIEANSARRLAVVVNRAIDYSGRSEVVIDVGEDSTAGKVGGAHDNATPPLTVRTTTLGGLVDEHCIGKYALVCDIEGSEAGIVEHDGAALQRCQQIIVELHYASLDGRSYTPDEILAVLVHRHGFALKDRRGPVCFLARQ